MAAYIEREAVLKEVEELKKSPWYNDDFGFGTKQARHDGVTCVVDLCIKQAPLADVVEVVRCKECKNKGWVQEPCHGKSIDYCRLHEFAVYKDDFCSYGERKGDNNE